MKRRILVLASIAFLGVAGRGAAQEPEYVENLRFVQALRQNGDTDLAIDLLNRMARDPNSSGALKSELPFEMALCRKAEAVNEPDNAKRLKLYETARLELIKFRDANPTHPRLAETKIDIAEITVLEGKTQVSLAMAQDGVQAQSTGLVEARKKFEAAAVELDAINKDLAAKVEAIKDDKDPVKVRLEKTLLRAELTAALNLFDIATTYHDHSPSNAVLLERGRKVELARKALEKVAANDNRFSETWQAQAWMGRCLHELGEPKKAREKYAPIIDPRTNSTPAGADGRRLARYFRLLVMQEQIGNGQAETGENTDTIVASARDWVRDYPRSVNTAEGYGVRYLLAKSLLAVAAGEKTPPARKAEYRTDASKLLTALAGSENEFTDRARNLKIELMAQEGSFTKDVSKLEKFEDCYYRAQFEIMQTAVEAGKLQDLREKLAKAAEADQQKLKEEFDKKQKETEQNREKHTATLIEALERGLARPDARGVVGNDVKNATAMLTYYYLLSRKYADAIRVGEPYARLDTRSTQGGMAAAYTLQAYGATVAEHEFNLKRATKFTDDQGKTIDEAAYRKQLEDKRKGMLAFAAHCEKSWSTGMAGNIARHQLGLIDLREKKVADGIKKLNAITPDYHAYVSIQNLIADESFKAEADMVPPFADAAHGEKAPVAWRDRAFTALKNIPEPSADEPAQLVIYFQAQTRLGIDMYRFKKFKEMKALAEPLMKKVDMVTFNNEAKLNGEVRDFFRGQLTKIQVYATYGQVEAAFKANDFKGVAALVDPELVKFKAGMFPQVKNDPIVPQMLQALLGMGLQSYIQLGDLAKVKTVVEVYGKAIGEDPATVAVPEIVRRLVPIINAQIRELRKNNDPNLAKVQGEFAQLLDDIQKQAGKGGEFYLVLAQCYSGLEQNEKALGLLKLIPDPDAELNALKDKKKLLEAQLKKATVPAEKTKLDAELKMVTETLAKKAKEPQPPPDARRVFQAACLARLRMLREEAALQPKRRADIYKECDGLLNSWMGTADAPGWAAKMIDAHKERMYLYEMDDNVNAGFNKAQALVKSMSAKIGVAPDAVTKAHYLECYWYMVYFLNESAKRSKDSGEKEKLIANAAGRMVTLETQFKDFGSDEYKKKFTDLLNGRGNGDLKAAYEKAKTK